MKVFKWITDKATSSSSTASKGEITVEKALAFTKEIEKLGKYFIFLENYVEAILNTEPDIEEKIEELKSRTKQNLKKEQLIKELWILRYTILTLNKLL